MALGDLTTLANVKAWRTPPITTTADDTAVTREIAAASRAVLQKINRKSIGYASYIETRNGMGTSGMKLREYPVNLVTSVIICGQTVPAVVPSSASSGYGFVWDQDFGMLYLNGFTFDLGFQNVTVAYTAGLVTTDIAELIPASSPFTIPCSQLSDLWYSDAGMVYAATAIPLVAVTGAPQPGQYIPPNGPDGYYQFNAADASAAVDISYGWTPRDVEEATINAVILEYNRRNRIGENAKALAGENITYYSSKAFTETTLDRLRNYTEVVPNP